MIDITSDIELDKLDTYTKGHVNFRKEDYCSFSYRNSNLYFDKDSGALRFVFGDERIYDVKNKFFEEIGTEGIVIKRDDSWFKYCTSSILYIGSAREKMKTIALDILENHILSDKNDDKYRVFVYKDGSMIKVYKKNGDFLCSIDCDCNMFNIYNLFVERVLCVSKENGGELYEFLYKYFEKCSLLLSNELVKTVVDY